MNLLFNKRGISEGLTFILATADHRHLGQINTIDDSSISADIYLNSSDKITFDVCKEIEKNGEIIKCFNWNKIVSRKYIWCKELDEYFVIDVQDFNEGGVEKKSVIATDSASIELSDKKINGTEINTEDDIARDNYKVTKFYDESDPKASLLDRVLDRAPHWSIGHVDASLKDMQRSFSLDGTGIYDFLTGECAEEFNCLFLFDTVNRIINVYDLYTVCLDCGNRDENTEFIGDEHCCPKCGSKNLSYFGEDTTVFVDTSNLTDKIEFTTDTDNIKNCFRLKTGDDLMDASVAAQNPNGSMYITYITDEMYGDMSEELVAKLKGYNALYDSYIDEYQSLMSDLYEAIDKVHYYNSSMMPAPEDEPHTAVTECKALNDAYYAGKLSPTAVSYVSESLSKTSVENVLETYARLYVRTGYVKVEAKTQSLSEMTTVGSVNQKTWTGTYLITDYNVSEEDVKNGAIKEAETATFTIVINDDFESFVKTKVLKEIEKNADKSGDVYNVLTGIPYVDINVFRERIEKYSLQRLKSFDSAVQAALDVMIELGIASSDKSTDQYNGLYKDIYLPYFEKHTVILEVTAERENQVKEWEAKRDDATQRASEIQAKLNFRDYLGDELYKEFCNYSIDDEYSNSNYISDGLSNAECFEMAKQFLEKANKEIKKAATPQHTISADLYNLFLMEEFQPLYSSFKLGNFIRAKANDKVYRLRLIKYSINCGDVTKLGTEFSDFTISPSAKSDISSIISQASSIGSTYQFTQTQAVKGEKAKTTIEEWVYNGLSSANMSIKSNNNENVLIDNGGIWGRTRDEITGKYEPKQFRITHNQFAFTKDNWITTSLALGEHTYKYYDPDAKVFKDGTDYGLTAKFLQAPYITGGSIVGGDIYSSQMIDGNPVTHFALDKGNINIGGTKLVYDYEKNELSISGTITGSTIVGSTFTNSSQSFKIDTDGTIQGASIIGSTFKNSTNTFSISSNGDIVGATFRNNNGTFSVDSNGNIVGANIKNTSSNPSFSVSPEGALYASNAQVTGEINADSGRVSYFTITKNGLEWVDNDDNEIYNGTKIWSNTIYTDYIQPIQTNSKNLHIGNGSNFSSSVEIWAPTIELFNDINLAHNYNMGVIKITGNGVFIDGGYAIHSKNIGSYAASSVTLNGTTYTPTNGNINLGTISSGGGSGISTRSSYYDDSGATWQTGINYIRTRASSTKGIVVNGYQYKSGSSSVLYDLVFNADAANNVSDKRLKDSIERIPNIHDLYMELEPIKFNWNKKLEASGFDNRTHIGLEAQKTRELLFKYNLNSVLTGLVYEEDSELDNIISLAGRTYYALDKDELHAMHIQMIQKHDKEIETLKRENTCLKGELDILKQQMEEIKRCLQ